MNTKGLTIAFTIVTIGIVGTAVFLHTQQDYDRPEITFAKEDLKYWENMDNKLLLDGVSAKDERDGDVSATLIIEKVVRNKEENAVMVTYAAKDYSNNVCKVTKKWDIAITMADLDFDNTGNNASQEIEESASDDLENSVSENQTVSANETTDPEALQAAEDAQTEETDPEEAADDDEETQPTPEELAAQAEAAAAAAQPVNASPTLQTTANEASIPVGGAFDPYSLVGAVSDDVDTEEILRGRVQIEGQYLPGTPGDYTLTYYVVDTGGALSEKSTVGLHVTQ